MKINQIYKEVDPSEVDLESPVFYVRPIRQYRGWSFAPGSDVVTSTRLSPDEQKVVNEAGKIAEESIDELPNRYDCCSNLYDVGAGLVMYWLVHVKGERTHLKFYRQ